MGRSHALVAVVTTLSATTLLGGCGSNATSPTTILPNVTAAATADPATATPSTDPAFTWMVAFTVNLNETAGAATTVHSVSANLQQASAGVVITPPAGQAEVFRYDVKASSNRIDAKGHVSVDFTFFYALPNAGREALATITINLVDDQANASSQTVTVKIA
jgi:hypothetical protein